MEPNIAIDLPIGPNFGDPEEVGLKNILQDLERNKISLSETYSNKYAGSPQKWSRKSNQDKEINAIENRLKLTIDIKK